MAILIWAGWSGLWITMGLNMEPSVVGTGWLAIAAFGAVLAIAMLGLRATSDFQLFRTQAQRSRIRRFNEHALSSTPLHFHVLALAAWSFLTVEWWVVNLGIVGRTIVGYGWLLIALYGLGLGLGLAAKHDEAIVEEVDEITPAELDLQS